MAEPMIPAGAFAAMKAGNAAAAAAKTAAQPAPFVPKVEPIAQKPETKAEPSPSEMTPAEKKIWKLKADGEEFEFDASDEEQVKREIMKARGADKRFKEAAKVRGEAEQFVGMLKDPAQLKKLLEDPRIGMDVKKFAKDLVWEEIQESQMTPEQKTQRERDKEFERLKAKESRDQEEHQTRQQRERQAHYEANYEQKITKALDIGGVPKTHATVSRMAEYMLKAVEHNIDLSPEELVQQVRKDYMSDFHSVISDADGELILQLLGDKNLEKLRQADLKRLRSAQGNPFPQRPRTPEGQYQNNQVKKVPGSVWKEDMIKSFLARPK